jgi:hypothetical protein
MACPCCGTFYCHADSPCKRDIYIKVTWGELTVISNRVQAAGSDDCGRAIGRGGFSGTGIGGAVIGTCTDRAEVATEGPYGVSAGITIGWSQDGQGLWANPSFCWRTSRRGAKIFCGRIGLSTASFPIVDRPGAIRAQGQQWVYDFSFPSLDQAASKSFFAFNTQGFSSPCHERLTQPYFDAEPQISLIVGNPPPDFCSASSIESDFPPVSGPYSTLSQCNQTCSNPLP